MAEKRFLAATALLSLFLLVASFSSFARAANLSTEQQLDVLAARIAANENAVFNESNSSGNAIVFEKQGSGPYHSVFRYIAVYAPRNTPWNEIFEINTERSIGDLDRSGNYNDFLVYLALPESACPGCYQGRPAPDKFKALYYCPKTHDREYPNYPVYWEGNTFTPDYAAVVNALTKSCLEAQDEIARLETAAPSPLPSPSPSLLPSPTPTLKPTVQTSPSPSPASEETTNASANASNETYGVITVFARQSEPASGTGLVAAGAVSEDEQWIVFASLVLVAGVVAIIWFFSRKK